MHVIVSVLLILSAVFIGLFLLTFAVYFFNMDMKLMAAVEPLLNKLYDKRKRERKL